MRQFRVAVAAAIAAMFLAAAPANAEVRSGSATDPLDVPPGAPDIRRVEISHDSGAGHLSIRFWLQERLTDESAHQLFVRLGTDCTTAQLTAELTFGDFYEGQLDFALMPGQPRFALVDHASAARAEYGHDF